MKNKESSYYRLFRLTMIIILCVSVIIGVVIISICTVFYKKSRLNTLRSSGEFFISCVTDEYKNSPDNYLDYADVTVKKMAEEYRIRIYMYDGDGKCLVSPDGNASNTAYADSEMRKDLDDKDYLNIQTAAVSQNVPRLVFGSKFFFQEPDGQYTPAYLLAYGTTDEIDTFTLAVTLAYTVAALAAAAACYMVFKKRTKEYMDFENELVRITKKYSKGDFSEKLSCKISPNLQHISDFVNVLASNVEKSEEKSSTFIANVSHELRTPMTTIGGFVDGILDGTIKKSRQQEYLVLVSQEIQRLRILITSMLNMSKFESGTMIPNFKETNLTDLVIKVVLMFEKRIEEKELQIEELDSSRLTAVVDADLMQQVIYNLVENAVKFVNHGGTLSFTFDQKDDICIIGIRNTGEGLKNSEIQQVFDRFYKTDSSRGKDTTGLGLGLSISRKIVHLHNGHIVVKSVYGEYTEFQIQIPTDPRLVDSVKKI